MIDFSRIHDIINSHNSFLISTHINPDGDAIGSELAMYNYLKSIGKNATIINYSSTPENLLFIDPENTINIYNAEVDDDKIYNYDVIFVLDLNQLSRTGELDSLISRSGKTIVCIDHHQNPENFTENLFVDSSYASTGEILFDLFENSQDYNLSYEIALPLYVAIVTDTGSFKYERTKPATHIKAAKLLSAGIDPKSVYANIYDQGNINKIKLLARALNSIELHHSGKVAVMTIYRKDLVDTGTTESDMESFVNYTLNIKNVVIGFFIYELESGVKISFRSVGEIPVNKLAAEFGGGGHTNAAATRISGDKIENVSLKVIESSQKYLKQ